jgi:hypothetical protein
MPTPAFPVDYQHVFRSLPGLYLLLAPDGTILDHSEQHVQNALLPREQAVGRNIFEAYPSAPESQQQLAASHEQVRRHRRPDTMPLVRYDLERPARAGRRQRGTLLAHYPLPHPRRAGGAAVHPAAAPGRHQPAPGRAAAPAHRPGAERNPGVGPLHPRRPARAGEHHRCRRPAHLLQPALAGVHRPQHRGAAEQLGAGDSSRRPGPAQPKLGRHAPADRNHPVRVPRAPGRRASTAGL